MRNLFPLINYLSMKMYGCPESLFNVNDFNKNSKQEAG